MSDLWTWSSSPVMAPGGCPFQPCDGAGASGPAGAKQCVVGRFAMKTLEKEEMLERNKVMRVLTEEQILQTVDHPFLASLAGIIETPTHLHFLMEFCEGGELYALLTSKPMKRLKESHMRFYCAEVSSPPTSRAAGRWRRGA